MRKKLLITYSTFRKFHNFTLKPNHSCDSVESSKLQWRGWSQAACVPSETSDTRRKCGPRVPKHERRVMVESFVNKYRSENAGNFPTISYTKKKVGGSYYVIREIVQELEYKSKMKSLNSMDGILVENLFDESKLKTAESLKVSSGNIETAKDRPNQDNPDCELLEEKRGPPTSSQGERLSNEVETITTPDNHCIISESNISEKHFKEPSNLQIPNDVKTEEAVSSLSDSVAPESPFLQEEAERFSTPPSESYGAVYDKTKVPGSEFVDIENHKELEEKCIEKASYERREQSALDGMSGKASYSSPQVPNDVKNVQAVTSCPSDYVAPERHLLKEEIVQVSTPLTEKSGSTCSKDQIHESKFVDIENHPTRFEKAGFERKVKDGVEDLPGVDSPKQEKEQSQGSLKSDKSKIDSTNKEVSGAVASDKSTLWGNLKSFADGIFNIWKKF